MRVLDLCHRIRLICVATEHLTENARASLKKIKNVQTAVKAVKLNRAKVGDWNVLYQVDP